MDAYLDSADRAFRDDVRAFIADNLPPEIARGTRRTTSAFYDPAHALPWQRILHGRGWAAPDWPTEYGGTGWTPIQRYIFASECARAYAPALPPMGLKMVAPVIMHYGTAEQKARYLPRILSAEDYWCQGFSEPGSGSDLASLKLRAESDGDDYVLNGSKIWTTHAHHANRMFCLVRTSNSGRPQAGISFLLLDMATPGIQIRPIWTIAGDHDFNQVFFDNVRVPKRNRLGDENDGWTVAKHLLTFERGGRYAPASAAYLAMLREAAGETGWIDEPGARERLAAEAIDIDALVALEIQALRGEPDLQATAIQASLAKIMGTESWQRLDALALEIAGPAGLAVPNAASPDYLAAALPRYFNNRAATIYGGSNEIQRDLIARALIDAR